MKILNFSALNAIETIKIYSRRELSKDSEFSILLYTQNRELGNLRKRSFTSNFYRDSEALFFCDFQY